MAIPTHDFTLSWVIVKLRLFQVMQAVVQVPARKSLGRVGNCGGLIWGWDIVGTRRRRLTSSLVFSAIILWIPIPTPSITASRIAQPIAELREALNPPRTAREPPWIEPESAILYLEALQKLEFCSSIIYDLHGSSAINSQRGAGGSYSEKSCYYCNAHRVSNIFVTIGPPSTHILIAGVTYLRCMGPNQSAALALLHMGNGSKTTFQKSGLLFAPCQDLGVGKAPRYTHFLLSYSFYSFQDVSRVIR